MVSTDAPELRPDGNHNVKSAVSRHRSCTNGVGVFNGIGV